MGDLYLGIDLGTTNSVVGYGNLTTTGELKCKVLEVEQKNENGGKVRSPILPSVVYYAMDNKTKQIMPEVGMYAKSRYGMIEGYVLKSVKSLMGTGCRVPLNEEIMDKTPAEVSRRILDHLLVNVKARLFQSEVSDVVITVPASFDSDKCQDTLNAAKLAGINIENEHDVLLYEPKAVIYDFIHMQESGELPADLIEFSDKKNILVFDLGGGTLDVSIHKVGYKKEGMMEIEDLAIARYTLIGGDNFDELLARDFYHRFVSTYHLKIPEKRKEEVMCKLRVEAEKLKMNLSNDYEQAKNVGRTLGDDYTQDAMCMYLYDSYSFMEEYSIGDLKKIFYPLMGEELSRKDAARIDSIPERQMTNIIYPILDVLAKTEKDIKIDYILLNGGMTRFFLIKDRIDRFFNMKSLVTQDPDLSVARGAVYYHYCLHKYNVKRKTLEQLSQEETLKIQETPQNTSFINQTILNDTINLGIKGEYVSQLVKAGTKLPYSSGEITGKYKLSSYMNSVAIEIFLGRGKTKNLPNRRIADRIVTFDKKYPANTPISFRILIDTMKMMRLEAWVTQNPSQKALITLDTNSSKIEKVKRESAKITSDELVYMNAKGELNQLKVLAHNRQKYDKGKTRQKMEKVLENIHRANNPEDFYEPIMEGLKQLSRNDLLRGYYYAIADSLCEKWSNEQKKQLLKDCRQYFEEGYVQMFHDPFIVREAAKIISKYYQDAVSFLTSPDIARNFSDCTCLIHQVVLDIVSETKENTE